MCERVLYKRIHLNADMEQCHCIASPLSTKTIHSGDVYAILYLV